MNLLKNIIISSTNFKKFNNYSNEELENEYRKKNDLTYESTTLLTSSATDEKYRLKDEDIVLDGISVKRQFANHCLKTI